MQAAALGALFASIAVTPQSGGDAPGLVQEAPDGPVASRITPEPHGTKIWGGMLSRTSTSKLVEAVRPAPSWAVHVTLGCLGMQEPPGCVRWGQAGTL